MKEIQNHQQPEMNCIIISLEIQEKSSFLFIAPPPLQNKIETRNEFFEDSKSKIERQEKIAALPITNLIASLLLVAPKERQSNPNVLKEGLGDLFNGFQDILQGAISDDPEQIETARNRMEAFRRYLENQGITVSDDFDTLPDKLHQRCQTATTDPELKERAQEFVKSIEEVKQSFTNLLQTLKSGAEKLRETLEEVSGRE